MGAFRTAVRIAAKDVKQRTRDRSLIMIGLVVPLALAAIFSLLLSSASDIRIELGVVDEDGSELSGAFVSALEDIARAGVIVPEALADRAAAETAVADGRLDAAIVIPAGFAASLASDAPRAPTVVAHPDRTIPADIAEALVSGFVAEVEAVRLSVAAGLAAGLAQPDEVDRLAADAASIAPVMRMVEVPAPDRSLDAASFYAAGMAVFFVFFTVQFGVTGLLEERRDGTLLRLLAAPVPRSAILGGKVLTSFGLGIASMAVLLASAQLLLGARFGDPFGVALLIVGAVCAATGVVAVVAAVARTPEQAGSWQSIVAVALGLLGGAFFPVEQASPLLATIAAFTPHHAFLRGLGDLAGGAAVTAILPSVATMVLFGIALVGVSAPWLRRAVEP